MLKIGKWNNEENKCKINDENGIISNLNGEIQEIDTSLRIFW